MKFGTDYDYNFELYCRKQSCCPRCEFGKNKSISEVMVQDCKCLYLEKYFNKHNDAGVIG